jgi:hypothetical protein
VQNAQERDRNMIKTHVEKALSHFRRGKAKEVANSMTSARSNAAPTKQSRGSFVKDGIDMVKLATSDSYHDKVLAQKPMDLAWMNKVTEYREEGEKILAKRNRKKPT